MDLNTLIDYLNQLRDQGVPGDTPVVLTEDDAVWDGEFVNLAWALEQESPLGNLEAAGE